MTIKILTIFMAILSIITNVSAKGLIPVFKEKSTENIYCDTAFHWCNYSANRLYNEGIFTGIKIGKKYYFMPDESITRGEFLLYIDAILNLPDDNTTALPFRDAYLIPHWQLSVVRSMYKSGYINGKGEKDGTYFNNDEKISRLECAIVLNNILGLKTSADSTDFYDNYLIPTEMAGAVKNVSDYGLMTGYSDKSFRPYVKVNRAMLADILCRTKDYYNKKSKFLG